MSLHNDTRMRGDRRSALAGCALAAKAWLRERTLRQWIWGVLLSALVAALVVPYLSLWHLLPLPLAAASALIGYLARRRWSDAGWLALPLVLFDQLEPGMSGLLLLCVAMPVFALTRRPRFAVLLAGGLLLFLVAAIHLKYLFGGSWLTWQDVQFFFLQFRANVGVMASQPTVVGYAMSAALAFIAVALLGWRWDDFRPRPPRHGSLIALLAFLVAAWCTYDVVEKVRDAQRRGTRAVAVWDRPLARFFATAGLGPVWQPSTIDTAAFRERVARRVGSPAASASSPADILVFLQESQFNPATLEGCPPALCRLPVFGADGFSRAHGPMQVHIFGGGTWLTEFAAATGVPHTAFGAAGDFVPFSVAMGVRHSLPRSLRAAGYRTVMPRSLPPAHVWVYQ